MLFKQLNSCPTNSVIEGSLFCLLLLSEVMILFQDCGWQRARRIAWRQVFRHGMQPREKGDISETARAYVTKDVLVAVKKSAV